MPHIQSARWVADARPLAPMTSRTIAVFAFDKAIECWQQWLSFNATNEEAQRAFKLIERSESDNGFAKPTVRPSIQNGRE